LRQFLFGCGLPRQGFALKEAPTAMNEERGLTQRLGAAEPQPNWRKTGYWYNSLRDETTNFSYRYRRFASFY
jgi:hypothetical protein